MRALTVTITYVLADSVSQEEAEEFKTSLEENFNLVLEAENMHCHGGDISHASCEVNLVENS